MGEEEEQIVEPVEENDKAIEDSEADSGVNSESDSGADETEGVEEDGPLEDWTVKELKDECKTLGLSDKGKKAELIERIREAQAKTTETVEEFAVEEEAVKETVEEPVADEQAVEPAAVEEAAVEETAVEEAVVEEAVVEEAAVEEAAAVTTIEE